MAVPDVTGDWAAAEAEQAALSDPRTRSVAGVSVVKTGDAVSVDITLYPVNIDRDVKVTANFTLPGA